HSARHGQDTNPDRAGPARRRPRGRALVNRPPDFRDIVGDDLSPAEEARRRRAPDLLVAAGPPPELPQRLAEPPSPQGRLLTLAQNPLRTRRVLRPPLRPARLPLAHPRG